MSNYLSPHDRLLRSMMAKPKVVKEFFSNYLPVHIKDCINLDSIKLQKESFIDDKLRMQITDLLYSAQFGQRQGYLYLLVEHQSTPDKLMAFRILKYKVAIFEHHMKTAGSKTLPVVVPLILYSGKRPYNYSTNIFDLFGSQKALAEDVLYKPYQLVDLQKIPDEEFRAQLWFGVMARMMKYIHDKDVLPHFKAVMSKLKDIEIQGDSDYTYKIISYLFEAGEVIDQEEFVDTLKKGLTVDEEKIMTLAETYRAEGRAEGELAAIRKVALHMLDQGMSKSKVASLTKMSEQTLIGLLSDSENSKRSS